MDKKKIIGLICAFIAVTVAVVIIISRAGGSKKEATTTTETTVASTTVEATKGTTIATTEQEMVEDVLDPEVESSLNAKTTKAKATKKDEKTTKKAYSTTKITVTAQKGEANLTVDETIEILEGFYGTTYRVSQIDSKNGFELYLVKDKKGNDYAIVRVDPVSGDASENIIQTGEENYYNLLV